MRTSTYQTLHKTPWARSQSFIVFETFRKSEIFMIFHALPAVPLARYLGLEKVELGRTLDLSKDEIVGILKSKDKALIHSLYRFSDAFTRK